MQSKKGILLPALGALLLFLASIPAYAYTTYLDSYTPNADPILNDLYAPKWDGAAAGTGAVVSWGYASSGTLFGRATTDLASQSIIPASYHTLMTQAFSLWSSVANITFVYDGSIMTSDGPLADTIYNDGSGYYFNDPRTGTQNYNLDELNPYQDIRIGGSNLTGLTLGIANIPDEWAGSGLWFDLSRGDWDVNEFLAVAIHEIGHTIGIGHSDVAGSIMNPTLGVPYQIALGTDDIAAAQYLYGAVVVPEPATWLLFLFGILLVWQMQRRTA
jgi:hypothetical protein